jgi:hypothetical protein
VLVWRAVTNRVVRSLRRRDRALLRAVGLSLAANEAQATRARPRGADWQTEQQHHDQGNDSDPPPRRQVEHPVDYRAVRSVECTARYTGGPTAPSSSSTADVFKLINRRRTEVGRRATRGRTPPLD